MKKLLLFIVLVTSAACVHAQTQTLHDFSARDILGFNVDFSEYHGKKVMIVNTASFCAFAPQYEDLQDLHEQYQQYNFEIVGFPCNDFDNQEPGSDSTILEFCEGTYGVSFRMMSRIVAVDADTAPIYRWLQEEELNGVSDASVSWNFNKFLIDEAGHWVAHHSTFVNPMSSTITDWIMSPSALGINDNQTSDLKLFKLISTGHSVEIRANATSEERISIDLYAADGKLVDAVYAGRITSGQSITYSTETLPAGIYLLRATSSKGQQALRFVVGN